MSVVSSSTSINDSQQNAYIFPPELLRPVPRRVKLNESIGCLASIVAALTLWEGTLVCFLAQTLWPPRDAVVIGMVAVAAAYFGYLWWVVFDGVAVRLWVGWRLCRWGKAVVGQVIGRREKLIRGRRGRKTWTYFVDYEFDHPGLGKRSATREVSVEFWRSGKEGTNVTVLCRPHRRRGTTIYEYEIFQCL